jgi:hypothetical protein
VADSGAVRTARYKRHKAGDHALCKHGSRLVSPLSVRDPGELDPALELRTLASRLAVAYEADPGNAALARELRVTLLAIGPGIDETDQALKELFGEFDNDA